jgi:hypothetical protein
MWRSNNTSLFSTDFYCFKDSLDLKGDYYFDHAGLIDSFDFKGD